MPLEKSWFQIGAGAGVGGLLAFLSAALISMAASSPVEAPSSLPGPAPASLKPVLVASSPPATPGKSKPRSEEPKKVPAPVPPVVATRDVALREFRQVLIRPVSYMNAPGGRVQLWSKEFAWERHGEMPAGELVRLEQGLRTLDGRLFRQVQRIDGSRVVLQETPGLFRECWRLDVSPDARQLADTRNAFAWDLYHQFQHQPGNLFFSPSSIAEALSMALAGARTETAVEISRALKLDNGPANVHAAAADLRKLLIQPDRHRGFELLMADRAWAQQGFTIEQPFAASIQQSYGAEMGLVDFEKNGAAACQEINDWIGQQTKGLLPAALNPADITPNMRLMLVNAVYFFGEWDVPFKKERTKEEPFFLSGGTQKLVPMMNRHAGLPYFHGNGLQAVSIPYGKGQLAMVVLVPDEVEGLAKLEASLSRQAVDGWVAQMKGTDIELALPRAEMKSRFDLIPILKSLGIARAFDPGLADFTGMHIPDPGVSGDTLFIRMVVHEAIVKVDEVGTEAAAATAVGVSAGIPPAPPPKVRADRPFVFLIRDQLTGSILFVGRVSDPK
ncbi:MAG: serpin family protein [Pirellulaceae bacterium]